MTTLVAEDTTSLRRTKNAYLEMNKTLNNIFKGDKVIWMVFLFLCIVSVIEVYSASAQLTYNGSYFAPVAKHVALLAVGLMCMIVTMNIPCRYFKVALPFLLVLSIITLVGVYFMGAINDGHRWFKVMGIQFQPSEIAKGTYVLATAQILSAMQTGNGADKNAFRFILIVGVLIVPLIFFENLSTAVLLCAVIFMMMIIGRVPMIQLGKLLGLAGLLASLAFVSVMCLGKDTRQMDSQKQKVEVTATAEAKNGSGGRSRGVLHRLDTWKTRIDKFIDSKDVKPEEVDIQNDDAQRAHANIAIVSSGITGKGPGNSEERDFLSQAFSDFIYAIIIEEMGLLGAFGVALLYIILLIRTGIIANRCENNFPAYLAMGLALMLVTQALFNMMVAVGLAPITGQPLPLISKGGTSTIINCMYLGAILSISRTAAKRTDLKGKSDTTAAASDNTLQPAY